MPVSSPVSSPSRATRSAQPSHSMSTTSSGRNVVITRPPGPPQPSAASLACRARSSSGDSVVASTSMLNRSNSARGRNVRLGQPLGELVVDLVGGVRAAAAWSTPKTVAKRLLQPQPRRRAAEQVPVLGEACARSSGRRSRPGRRRGVGTPSCGRRDALAEQHPGQVVVGHDDQPGRVRERRVVGQDARVDVAVRGDQRQVPGVRVELAGDRRAAPGSAGNSRSARSRCRLLAAGPAGRAGRVEQVGDRTGAPVAIDSLAARPVSSASAPSRAVARAAQRVGLAPPKSTAVIRASAPPWPLAVVAGHRHLARRRPERADGQPDPALLGGGLARRAAAAPLTSPAAPAG